MGIVDLRRREHEAAVVRLLAAAQIHREPEDALTRAPSIADEYARSATLRLWGYQLQDAVIGDGGSEELTGAARVGMHPVLVRVPDRHLSEGSEADGWQGSTIASLGEVLSLAGCG